MGDKLFVIAGSHAQSEYWRKQANVSPREWVYLHDPRQLRGVQRPRYIRVGTWMERTDLEPIMWQLEICNAVYGDAP